MQSDYFILQELRGGHANQACAWMNGPIRLRQHGTSFSFSRKVGSLSQLFVKKNGLFRPAGGEMSFQVSDCVTPVIL